LGADLTRAAQALTHLDDALANHPLQVAALYRLRLEAVRQMALMDGAVLDPVHLAATLQGLRLQLASDNPWERADIIDATNAGFALHQALTRPSREQRVEIAHDIAALRSQPKGYGPLLAAAACLATSLDVLPKAAHKLLNRFVEKGVAREMTGRGAWRLYMLSGDL